MKTLDVRAHAFNVGIAIDYSPTMSLWLGHLAFWTEKNLANNKNIHDGHVWSYGTIDAFLDLFPYFTKSQIETMINNSVKEGFVIKGNYNKTNYDRTCWYALTPKAFEYFPHLSTKKYIERMFLSISENSEMDLADFGNQFPNFRRAIPDTDPDTDPNTTTTTNIDRTGEKELSPATDSSGSGSFTSFEKDCLKLRLDSDKRTEQEFLKNVHHHVENNSDQSKPKIMRQRMALSLLKQVKDNSAVFESVGYVSEETSQETDSKNNQAKLERLKAQWENYYNSDIEKSCREQGYKSKTLEQWITDHE